MSLNKIQTSIPKSVNNLTFKGSICVLTYSEGKLLFDKSYKISKQQDKRIKDFLFDKFRDRKLIRLWKNEVTDRFHEMMEKFTKTKVENKNDEKFVYINKGLDVILFGDFDKLKVIQQNGTEFIIDFLL